MIDAQLRAMAESVELAVPQAATLMMSAADAIDHLSAKNAELQKLAYDLLNAWDDMQHEVITGPTFDECERHAYELGVWR